VESLPGHGFSQQQMFASINACDSLRILFFTRNDFVKMMNSQFNSFHGSSGNGSTYSVFRPVHRRFIQKMYIQPLFYQS
jgi:hypothetical protein